MVETVVTLGVALIAVAIVGGAVKFGDKEFPPLNVVRSVLLGAFGVLLVVGAVGPTRIIDHLDGADEKTGDKKTVEEKKPADVEVPSAPSSSPSATTPSPARAATVFWSGSIQFTGEDGYSFDVRPPRFVDGKSIGRYWRNGGLRVPPDQTTMRVAEWTSDSVPDRDQCAATLTTDGSDETGGLSAGSEVCGLTAEGRILLVKVEREDGAIWSHVTVWSR